MKYRRIVHIALVRLLCLSTEKKDKISSAHNQIDAGNLLSNVLFNVNLAMVQQKLMLPTP